MLSLPVELQIHMLMLHFEGLKSLVTMGQFLKTCSTARACAHALWPKVAHTFLLPLKPLVTNFDDRVFNLKTLKTVKLIVEALHDVHGRGGAIRFDGCQREASVKADLLTNVGSCSEHEFTLYIPPLRRSSPRRRPAHPHGHINWRNTRAAPGERPATGTVTETVMFDRVLCGTPLTNEHERPMGVRETGYFHLRSTNDPATANFDPCEYRFKLHNHGLLVSLCSATIFSRSSPPLHQIGWGILHVPGLCVLDDELRFRQALQPLQPRNNSGNLDLVYRLLFHRLVYRLTSASYWRLVRYAEGWGEHTLT